MNREYLTYYSHELERDMHVLSYTEEQGPKGVPMLVIPSQDGMCDNYENFGMIDNIADFIDAGEVQVFVVDTIDQESWSDRTTHPYNRGLRQEAYYHFLVDEIVPWIRELNGTGRRLIATGCSLGATHAAILALRRPDLFESNISLSGVYDATYFTDGYMDSTWYDNSPVHFLPRMPEDHPYVEIYNKRSLIFCVGQGAWEDEGIRTAHILQDAFRAKNIQAWVDFWGYDVNHDWPWWRKQMRYFLPFVLEHYRRGEKR